MSELACVWELGAVLGEGPVWHEPDSALYFVDILGRRIHRFRPSDGDKRSWDAPARPTFIVPTAQGDFLCGFSDGLRRFDPSAGGFGTLRPVEPDQPGNRLNDGHVGADGRLWFGTMHDEETEGTGSLYSLDSHDAPFVRHDTGYVVSNGPAIDPERGRLYHNDSARRTIYCFDLAADGSLGNRRVFARTERGYPDGIALDEEGALWVALFRGHGVVRYAPDGSELQRVEFPCANVTKMAFIGPDRRTALVTTARKTLSDAELAEQPLAGGLFSFTVPVAGQAPGVFGLRSI
ncbi:SMP-30/gluconolactonase/LRE family protein [Rhizosaccharibacter radicis]|uniref:SMP-30/gluconolactonase/LRE family protein n=1 Tax=Rhizosaccharibacter radicis TaxID=2782605 RepID=A0ABT1VVL1_9PROT|nr:SMP-30/gluconolactonase/LRE family protein [Acetobacteraceae bacterium KSS12]